MSHEVHVVLVEAHVRQEELQESHEVPFQN